jgi:GntR family transcriptional regulator, arabinose operon transcriptional repressor
MLQRIEKPNFSTRDILLQTHTVVRSSCGVHLSRLTKTSGEW